MTSKRIVTMGIAGVAVAAVLAFALFSVSAKDGLIMNGERKGTEGMAEKLEFKNPVTIRLIDANGNVASEKVVYNAITTAGKAYIYIFGIR